MGQTTVLGLVIRDRGGCLSARAERQASSSQHLQQPHRRRGGGVVRPSRRRVLKALQALPLQSLHLAYEAGPSEMYGVPAWASGRPSRVVVSSAAGLIITVTDGGGEVIEREAGCATGPGPVAHDGGRSICVRLQRPQASNPRWC